jgi:4-carboxymuconolactone decarboxylase
MRMNKLFKQIFISSLSLLNIAYAQQKSIKETPLLKKELSIASIAANTAKGNMGQLHLALNKGLNNGLTIHETKEIIVQLYAYAGFPRSLNALNQFMSVLEERNKKGIKDKIGVEASINDKQETKLTIGTTNQTKLVGKPVSGKVYEFAPAIDQFLKEHLFGDIFGRDNLTWKKS